MRARSSPSSTEKFDAGRRRSSPCRGYRRPNGTRRERGAQGRPGNSRLFCTTWTTLQKEANSRYGFFGRKRSTSPSRFTRRSSSLIPVPASRHRKMWREIPALIGNMTRHPCFAEYASLDGPHSPAEAWTTKRSPTTTLPHREPPSELTMPHLTASSGEMVAGRMLETFRLRERKTLPFTPAKRA